MADPCLNYMDPRVRRTRQLLQDALTKVLETKPFEELSIQDIAEVATVNRATFYDHYPDKFALLECTVASRFHALLAQRGVSFDGTCTSALRAIVLGVCDYLASLPALECERQRQPRTPLGKCGDCRRAGHDSRRAQTPPLGGRGLTRDDCHYGKLGHLRRGQGVGEDIATCALGTCR